LAEKVSVCVQKKERERESEGQCGWLEQERKVNKSKERECKR